MISAKHIEFIRMVAQGVAQSDAYKATVGNPKATSDMVKSKASNLAKKYIKEIQQAKEKAAALVDAAHSSNVAKNALKSIVTQSEADAKAFRILGENDIVEDIIVVTGKVQIVKRKPTQAEIQRAYDLFCKRFGSNAPTKVAQTNRDGEDVEPIISIKQFFGQSIEIKENE